MELIEVQKQADILRHEAKMLLASKFRVPPDVTDGTVDRIVDAIISCAMLEVSLMISDGFKPAKAHPTQPESE